MLERCKEGQELQIRKVGQRAWRGAMQKDLEGLSTGTHAKGMTEVLSKNGLQGLGVVEMCHSVEEIYFRSAGSDFARKKAKIDTGYPERTASAGTTRAPYGHRTGTVRAPYGNR